MSRRTAVTSRNKLSETSIWSGRSSKLMHHLCEALAAVWQKRQCDALRQAADRRRTFHLSAFGPRADGRCDQRALPQAVQAVRPGVDSQRVRLRAIARAYERPHARDDRRL